MTTAPKHSKLSPSKAYQWTACTASIGYIEANRHRIPPERAGPAAIEGSLAHLVAESILLGQPLPSDPAVTKEMIDFGKHYAELCREKIGPPQHCHDWAVERRVPLFYLPEEAGTIDFNACTKSIDIVDYKFGFSKVESEGNKQMAIYAGSLIEHEMNWVLWPRVTDDTVVTMTIFQPRLPDDVETWSTTWGELREFLEKEVHQHARTILSTPAGVMKKRPNGTEYYEYDKERVHFAPSDKVCKWCPAYSFCEARTSNMLEEFHEAIQVGEEITVAPKTDLTDKQLLDIWKNRKLLEDWLAEIEKYLAAKVSSKEGLPGAKLVMSNGGHRFWTDEQKALVIMSSLGLKPDDLVESKVVSPAKAEKLTHHIKDKRMQELFALMAKPPGKPVMALESDPRPAWQQSVLSDFAGLLVDDSE